MSSAAPASAGVEVIGSRHVHIDFHTSPHVPDVGRNFDPDRFGDALVEASVNSITVFAKCHHGMAYYPTTVGARHPGLSVDLLGEMVEACHRRDIRVAAYVSTMYDQHVWREHQGWRALRADGQAQGHGGAAGPLAPVLGRVCVNTPYLDLLVAMGEEVVGAYPVDGLFWDNFTYDPDGCCCASCRREREKLGLDSHRVEDRIRHMGDVMDRAMARLVAAARVTDPRRAVYINGPLNLRRSGPFLRMAASHLGHAEIEALGGAAGRGYDHNTMVVRLLRTYPFELTGMTAGFHRSWGDFGSVRNQAALDYECFSMLAQGAHCAIGDHLHPRGRLDETLYARIGKTYHSVAEKEPWCLGVAPAVEIGVLLAEWTQLGSESNLGATRMLTELHHQFDLVHEDADLARYRVLVLPDSVRVDGALRERLTRYLAGGGRILASDESCLDDKGSAFALPMGVAYRSPWPFDDQYLEAVGAYGERLQRAVHYAYETGAAVEAEPQATVMARSWRGYFDRSSDHFQVAQAPWSEATRWAAVVATESTEYLAVPIFRAYAKHGYAFHRDLVGAALERLLPEPLLRAEGPHTLEVTVCDLGRVRILHLLHYVARRRAPDLDIVEDTIPLREVPIAVRLDRQPQQVYVAPERKALEFKYMDGYVRAVVPEVNGHAMVVCE